MGELRHELNTVEAEPLPDSHPAEGGQETPHGASGTQTSLDYGTCTPIKLVWLTMMGVQDHQGLPGKGVGAREGHVTRHRADSSSLLCPKHPDTSIDCTGFKESSAHT